MALVENNQPSPIEPSELAIASLRASIFNLINTGYMFLIKLDKLRTKIKAAGVLRALSPLEPVRWQAKWLVWFIRQCVETNSSLKDTTSERRHSVSFVVNVCTFELTYLSDSLWVQRTSSLSTREAFIRLFGRVKNVQRRISALNTHSKDLAQLLSYLDVVRPSPQRPLPYIPEPLSMVPRIASHSFVGRQGALKLMASSLCNEHRVALSGVKGIGKSELCVQYAKMVREQNDSVWVFWIDGHEFARSMAETARCLRISPEDGEMYSGLNRWLEDRSHGPWLIIFDNVDFEAGIPMPADEAASNPFTRYIAWLRSQQGLIGRGNLLVTSTDFRTWLGGLPVPQSTHSLTAIKLPSLDEKDAIDLLQILIGSQKLTVQDTKHAGELVTQVQCEPWALGQIANYMRTMRLTISQYLEDVDRIREMGSQLHLEDRLDTYHSGVGLGEGEVAKGLGADISKRVIYQQLQKHSTHNHIHTVDDIGASSTELPLADVMTTASFVARMFLSNAKLTMVFKMINKNAHDNSKLEAALKEYAIHLEFIAKQRRLEIYGKLIMFAKFIHKHPKRVSFTLMEQGLQAHEESQIFRPANPENSHIPPWPSKMRIGKQLTRRLSTSIRTCSSPEPKLRLKDSNFKELLTIKDFFGDESTVHPFVIKSCIDFAVRPEVRQVHEFVRMITSVASPAAHKGRRGIHVNYDVNWELQTVLERVFGKGQSIKEVAVISGEAANAQMTTCAEYVTQQWRLALPLLDVLDESNWGAENKDRDFGDMRIHVSGTREHWKWQEIVIEGTSEVQADVAATITWLTAAIRFSDCKRLSESRSSIVLQAAEKELCFRVEFLPLQEVASQESCWHQLFTCMAVAVDYPVKIRHLGRGLDINYELMTNVARTNLVTERDRGLVLRGFQFMLVPIKLLDHGKDDHDGIQALQWHVLQSSENENENDFFEGFSGAKPITSDWLRCKSRREFKQLASRRAFLGSWDKFKINIATKVQDYSNPAGTRIKSKAKAAGRPIALSTVGGNLGGSGGGASGGANLVAAIGERNVVAELSLSKRILSNLETMKAKNLVLYDTETRRAWMLPYPSVLLHLVHLKDKLDERQESSIELPYADVVEGDGVDGPKACDAAYSAMKPLISMLKDNSDNVKSRPESLSSPGTDVSNQIARAKILQEHLEDLCTWLDEADKEHRKSRNKAMDVTHKKVYGFEFKEIARRNFQFKEQRLHYTSGGWSVLRRDAGVIFCGNIGNAISPMISTPPHVCEKWTELPIGKDYLVAPLCCLSTSNEAQPSNCDPSNNEQSSKTDSCFTIWTSDQRMEWEVTSDHFLPCEDPREEHHIKGCQRTARMRTRRNRPGSKPLVHDFRDHMDAAIIFGRPGRATRLKKVMKSSLGAVKKQIRREKAKTHPTTLERFHGSAQSLAHIHENKGTEYEAVRGADNHPASPGRPVSPKYETRVSNLSEGLRKTRLRDSPPESVLPPIPGAHQQPELSEVVQRPERPPHDPTLSTTSGDDLHNRSRDGVDTLGTSPGTSAPGDSLYKVPKEQDAEPEAELEGIGSWAKGAAAVG